jgi:hypothetical protein
MILTVDAAQPGAWLAASSVRPLRPRPDRRLDRLLGCLVDRYSVLRPWSAALPDDSDHACPKHPEAAAVLGALDRPFAAKVPDGPVGWIVAVDHARATSRVGAGFQMSGAIVVRAPDSTPLAPHSGSSNGPGLALACEPRSAAGRYRCGTGSVPDSRRTRRCPRRPRTPPATPIDPGSWPSRAPVERNSREPGSEPPRALRAGRAPFPRTKRSMADERNSPPRCL